MPIDEARLIKIMAAHAAITMPDDDKIDWRETAARAETMIREYLATSARAEASSEPVEGQLEAP
jgi:hypothetical protein